MAQEMSLTGKAQRGDLLAQNDSYLLILALVSRGRQVSYMIGDDTGYIEFGRAPRDYSDWYSGWRMVCRLRSV